MFMSHAAMTEREVIRDVHHVTGGGLKTLIKPHKRNYLVMFILSIAHLSYKYNVLELHF